LFVIAEEGEVVHVAEKLGDFESFFDEVVKAVEVDVGEELAGEVADGKTTRTVWGQAQISEEVSEGSIGMMAVVDDGVDQP